MGLIAAALTLVLVMTGCDDAAEPSDAGRAEPDAAAGHEVLVGEVEDSDVRVGVLAGGAQLRVFLCGGPSSYATATRWVRAELDESGDFRFSEGELELAGSLVDGVLEAELIAEGERARIRAERVRAGTLAGLYEARAECGTVGLIVAQGERGAEPAAQGACVGDGHLPDQVNPIKPIAQDRSGAIAVEVVRGEDATRVDVRPARL